MLGQEGLTGNKIAKFIGGPLHGREVWVDFLPGSFTVKGGPDRVSLAIPAHVRLYDAKTVATSKFLDRSYRGEYSTKSGQQPRDNVKRGVYHWQESENAST